MELHTHKSFSLIGKQDTDIEAQFYQIGMKAEKVISDRGNNVNKSRAIFKMFRMLKCHCLGEVRK